MKLKHSEYRKSDSFRYGSIEGTGGIPLKKYDVTALGEILIDFTAAGKSDAGMRLFEQNPGGAPANVLTAVSKLGGETAFIGKIGRDMHGAFLRETLKKHRIDTRALIETGDAFTTLAFVELAENGERSFSFARKPGADTTLTETEVDFELIGDSRIFHVGSLSLTDEPARQATMSALKYASRHGVIVSYDPNYRAPLWNSREEAVHEMRSVLPYADVIKISEEEISLLTEKKTAEEAAEELQSGGIPCVIVTLGSKGALVAVKTGQIDAEAFPAKTVDTTGAGDAFMGGFLYMLAKSGKKTGDLSSDDAKAFTRFANAAASLCVEKRGAINAMPALLEVQGRLGKSYS